MSPTNTKPPTRRQLAYLRSLAHRAGETFTYPKTSRQASAEIARLKTVSATGFTFAELEAEHHARQANGDVPAYAAAFREDEVAGYGSTATWSQRA